MILEDGFQLIQNTIQDETNYIDTNTISTIENRQITLQDYTVVKGDNNLEIIIFEQDRYMEGIDLSTKQIEIIYKRSDLSEGKAVPVNFRYSVDKVRFTWKITSEVSAVAGQVEFAIRYYGTNYSTKTLSAILHIKDSLRSQIQEEVPAYGEINYLTPNEVSEIMLEIKIQLANS